MSSSSPLVVPWNATTTNNTSGGTPPPITSPSPVVEIPPPHEPSGLRNKTTLIALVTGAGIGGLMVLLFVCVCIFAVWYKRRKRRLAADGGLSCSNPQSGPKDDHFLHCPQQHMQHNASPQGGGDVVVNIANKPLSPDIISLSHQFSDASLPPPPPISCSMMSSYKKHQQTIPNCCVGLIKTTFSYVELESATARFSYNNILGVGGFGCVYKGVLYSGKVVAIKRLKHGSGQGEREFQAEVEMISRVQHKHLVSLVGFCTSGDQRLLVYEYVPNKTLDFHLHGDDCPFISWANRMKIALGSAKGLAYLHEECKPKIIHRDVKASNILLDNDFEAKVADFGLARLNYDADTHVSTRVMGTFGYLAPEYALTGKLTEKSDVFSFGVMLLELITGRRPIDKAQHYLDDNIVDWARPLLSQALEDGNFDKVVDQRLQKDYERLEMTRMVACAAVCIRHLARHRPRMSQVVQALEGNIPLEDLNKGLKPGHSTILGFQGSSDYDAFQYKEDLMKFKKMAFGSQEHNTSPDTVVTPMNSAASSSTER